MTDWTEQQIIGHLLGALDDDEQAYLDARLELDESCCRRMAPWRTRLAPLEMMRPDYEPPPGMAARTCRLVEAFGPPPPRPRPRRDSLSPAMVQLGGPAPVGWSDMIALGSLLLMLAALMLPALDSSRLHARATGCQNNLRQLGLAMTEYGRRHGEPLQRLAAGGCLTGAGLCAAEMLQSAIDSAGDRPLCPNAWLAVLGAAAESLSMPASERQTSIYSPASLTAFPRRGFAPGELFFSTGGGEIYTCLLPGDWRDGTRDATEAELPAAATHLLADAPSVISPGEAGEPHGGLGRNVYFDDGRVSRVPPAAVVTGEEPPAAWSSTPIFFINQGRAAR